MASINTTKKAQPPAREGRDFGLSLAVSIIILGLALVAADTYAPDAILGGEIAIATTVGAGCALLACIGSWLAFRRQGLIVELPVAALVTLLVYALVSASTWVVQTSSYRDATSTAASWRHLVDQDYEHVTSWTPDSSNPADFGTLTTSIEAGAFYVAISSNRDETGLTSPDGANQPTVGSDFFLQADITSAPGATDGYCTLIFGFTTGEHWFAFKIGPQGVAVSQDFGAAAHRYIYGPSTFKYARPQQNKLSMLSQNGTISLWVNRQMVTSFKATPPAGKTWVAPQAANRPDTVNCGFDNYRLDAP